MKAKVQLLVALLMQGITFSVGVLTAFGITLDPAQVDAFKGLVTDAGAHAVGLVLIVSALSGSIQDIVRRIRAQSPDKS